MKRVVFQTPALKAIGKLPADIRGRITEKLSAFAANPASVAGSVKALVGQPDLRLRVGDYRAIFRVEGDQITVTKIAHRREVYD